MNGKFFSEETKDMIVKVGDDLIKGNAIVEMADGPALRIVVNYLDKIGDKYVPDNFDTPINEAITAALNGQFEEAAGQIGITIDAIVDIPKVDDELEKLLFVDGLKFIARSIQVWIEKKLRDFVSS